MVRQKMPKIVKMIEDVVAFAIRNGESQRGPYRATYYNPEHRLDLYHYGTRILSVNEQTGHIYGTGGWSKSDKDAIYTAMQSIGFPIKLSSNDRLIKKENLKDLGAFYGSQPHCASCGGKL